MTFLNPILASVGLGCIAIPIIIHILMRRRRRPIPWAAMKFLIEAYRRQRRRMNLEQVLLLASRCLLVALLALALGKPVLGAIGLLSQGPRNLYVVIDNSLASSATRAGAADKPALDRSKAVALEMMGKLDQGRGDRVAIVSLAAPADPVVLPASADLSAAGELIKGMKPLDSKADLAGAILKVRDELKRTPARTGEAIWIAVLSEFRAGSADMESSLTALAASGSENAPVRLLVMSPEPDASLDNVGIVAVEPARTVLFAQSDKGEPVSVTLRRSGPGVRGGGVTKLSLETVRTSPNASGPGQRSARSETTVNWAAGKDTVTVPLNVEVPKAEGQGTREPLTLVATIDRDSILGDDVFRRPIDTRDRLEVALLASGPVGGKGTIKDYTPADWLAIALAPEADLLRRRQGGEIRVTVLDPARGLAGVGTRGAAGALGEFDAVLIPNPDQVDATGWRMVRGAADQGALVMISPPPDVQTHLWSDAMVEGLGLEWTVAREATELKPGATVSPERTASPGSDLLGQLGAELPELLKHVSVSRVLGVQGPPGSFEPLLRLKDGTPLIVTAQPGARGSGKSGPGRGLIVFLASAPQPEREGHPGWTDIPTKPLMVPLMQELVRQGVGRSAGPKTSVAGTAPVLPAGAAEMALIQDAATGAPPDSERGVPGTIPVDQAGRLGTPVRTQGIWNVRGVGGGSLGIMAFNADPQAGLVETRTREEVAHWLAPVSDDITWIEPGSAPTPGAPNASSAAAALTRDSKIPPISLPLLVAALAIGVIETGLARWFSHAKADAGVIKVEAAEAMSAQPAAEGSAA
jgi:Aerotolerance regulator N-terminal/von Willebrand factor type A domain